MNEAKKGELTALQDLLESDGWKMFTAYVSTDTDGSFLDDVTNALGKTDDAIVIGQLRQAAYARRKAREWLSWPKLQIDILKQKIDQEEMATPLSRRPLGL